MIMGDGTVPALLLTAAIAARAFGILLFGAAVVSKLRHFREFTLIVARYLAVPVGMARPAAALVTGLETATALLLLLPGWPKAGAMLAILLLLGFAGTMALALARGERELDCGCMYGALRQRVRWELVARNVVIAIPFVPLFLVPGWSDVPLIALDGMATGALFFILVVAFGVFLALDDSFAELKRRYG